MKRRILHRLCALAASFGLVITSVIFVVPTEGCNGEFGFGLGYDPEPATPVIPLPPPGE